jgi:hypothetical protein
MIGKKERGTETLKEYQREAEIKIMVTKEKQ